MKLIAGIALIVGIVLVGIGIFQWQEACERLKNNMKAFRTF